MRKVSSPYYDKLQDPRWQRRRLEVLCRDVFACCHCFDDKNTLHVHHLVYIKGRDPWEYELCDYVTLCKNCHLEVEETIELAKRLMQVGEARRLIRRLCEIIYSDPDIHPNEMCLKVNGLLDSAGL